MRDLTKIFKLVIWMALLLPLMVSADHAESLGYSDANINIGVYPPRQAYPGDNVTVMVVVEALKDLRDVDMYMYGHGSENEGYDSWSTYLSIMNDTDFSSGAIRDANRSLTIPSDADHGLVYATVYIHYKYRKLSYWSDYGTYITFQMTYLKSKAYEDLQTRYIELVNEYNSYRRNHSHADFEYDSLRAIYSNLLDRHSNLNSTYNFLWLEYRDLLQEHQALNSVYSFLRSDYDALISALGYNRNLNYILVTATMILIPSTSYIALDKLGARRKASDTNQQVSRKDMRRTKSSDATVSSNRERRTWKRDGRMKDMRQRETEGSPIQRAREILG